jgi:integrase
MKTTVEQKVLTQLAVEKYRPRPKVRRVIRDLGSRSLFLIIYPSGAKSWQMIFRVAGAGKSGRVKMTLGPVDSSGKELAGDPIDGAPLTLAAARSLAAEKLHQRARGRNPAADAKAARERQRTAAIEGAQSKFGVAIKEFVDHTKKNTRGWLDTARLLGLAPRADGAWELIRGGIAMRWADRDVTEIDVHDIRSIAAETRTKGVPGLERRSDGPTESRERAILNRLSSLFRWLGKHGRVMSNPVREVHRPKGGESRERVLTNNEIKLLWKASDDIPPPFAAALKLLLLCGCRREEVARLRWDEIAADGTSISLPGARTKNKRGHIVPLSAPAQKILAAIPRIDGSPYVFTTTGRVPINGWGKVKKQLDAAMGIPPWVVHDLRRTAASGMGELGIGAEVIELALNHRSGVRGGIAGIYNHSVQIEARRAALERWAAHVSGLVNGESNIIAMPPSKMRSGR